MNAELVTLIPPGGGGVRDYAETVAQHIRTRLLAVTPDTPLADYGDGDILLHFSGYGYQARGVPGWLVKRLRQLKSEHRTIGIFFHELFASGPPWRSAFWLHVAQRKVAMDLAQLADFWITNRQGSANWLEARAPNALHACLPICSNVGEPDLPAQRDPAKVIVFGGAGSRAQAYRDMDEQFWGWCRMGALEVHDIGPPLDPHLHQQLRQARAIHWHGALPAREVSRHLAEASYGVLSYPTPFVAKSGIFAAYCAHGMCPVLLASDFSAHDGLRANEHYAAGVPALSAGLDARRIGAEARNWYRPHRLEAHLEALRSLLQATRERRLHPACA